MQRPPRVLFFGMQGRFSLLVLHALLEKGIDVGAVVLPASPGSSTHLPAIYQREQPRSARSLLPVLNSALHSNIMQLAWKRHIPVWEVTRLADTTTISTFADYQPDCICVACFSQRIPKNVLDIPTLGCLNVHPSLLPANRGPEPLFWAFRQGLKQTGVSIHCMDVGMDTGDLLAQEVIEVPDGISYAHLEQRCAMRGGELLAQTVHNLYEGRATRMPQDETKASYQPFPRAEDYIVPAAEWEARRVYNFICGIADGGEPVKLRIGDEYIVVRKALLYSPIDVNISQQRDYCWQDTELWLRCKDGWVAVASPAAPQ